MDRRYAMRQYTHGWYTSTDKKIIAVDSKDSVIAAAAKDFVLAESTD